MLTSRVGAKIQMERLDGINSIKKFILPLNSEGVPSFHKVLVYKVTAEHFFSYLYM